MKAVRCALQAAFVCLFWLTLPAAIVGGRTRDPIRCWWSCRGETGKTVKAGVKRSEYTAIVEDQSPHERYIFNAGLKEGDNDYRRERVYSCFLSPRLTIVISV